MSSQGNSLPVSGVSLPDFTPGPWRVEGAGPNPNMGMWFVEGRTNVASYCTKADARLIAAAPDLLEALLVLKSAFAAFTEDANWAASALQVDTIRQVNDAPFVVNRAIAKALGDPTASPADSQLQAIEEQ
jgi:hypothetical protein